MSRWSLIAACALLPSCALITDAKPRVRIAGVTVGAGYAYTGGYYPYFGFPYFYDPLFFGFVHPGFYNGFAYGPNMGEVRLRTSDKAGAVFLDGAYAGELSKLKHIWLEPGAYNVEIRSDGHPQFERRIYVLSGKTVDLRPGVGQP
jgi:hypothetical protein